MVWYQYFVHMVYSHLCSRTIRPDNHCSFCRAWPTSFPQVKLPTINLATFTILFQGLKQSTCYGHCNHRWHWQVSYHLLDCFKKILNALLNFKKVILTSSASSWFPCISALELQLVRFLLEPLLVATTGAWSSTCWSSPTSSACSSCPGLANARMLYFDVKLDVLMMMTLVFRLTTRELASLYHSWRSTRRSPSYSSINS